MGLSRWVGILQVREEKNHKKKCKSEVFEIRSSLYICWQIEELGVECQYELESYLNGPAKRNWLMLDDRIKI